MQKYILSKVEKIKTTLKGNGFLLIKIVAKIIKYKLGGKPVKERGSVIKAHFGPIV